MTSRATVWGAIATSGIAATGLRVATVALPWFILTTTGSAAQTGLVVAAELGPYVIVKALSGPLVDRWGQRFVSILADLVSAVLFGLIPVLYLLDSLNVTTLLILVAVAGAIRGPGDAAKSTLIPLSAAACGMPLAKATGASGAVERTASLVGPAIAAVLIAAIGPPMTVLVTAGCFAASAVILSATPAVPRAERQANQSFLTELATGWKFLAKDRLLLGLSIMIMATNLLDVAFSSVFLPVWAEDSGHGIGAVGLLLTCAAAASIISSIGAPSVMDRLPRSVIYFTAFLITGPIRFLILAFDLPIVAMSAAMIVAGFASGFLNPLLGVVIYERIPADKLGKVTAPMHALSWAGMPFGGMVAAGLITGIGLSPALVVAAALYAAAVIVPNLVAPLSFSTPATPDAEEPSPSRQEAAAPNSPT